MLIFRLDCYLALNLCLFVIIFVENQDHYHQEESDDHDDRRDKEHPGQKPEARKRGSERILHDDKNLLGSSWHWIQKSQNFVITCGIEILILMVDTKAVKPRQEGHLIYLIAKQQLFHLIGY